MTDHEAAPAMALGPTPQTAADRLSTLLGVFLADAALGIDINMQTKIMMLRAGLESPALAEIMSLATNLDEALAALDASTHATADNAATMERAYHTIEELRYQIEQQTLVIEDLLTTINQLTIERNDLRDRLDDADIDYDAAQEHLADMIADRDAAREHLADTIADRDAAREHLADMIEDRDAARAVARRAENNAADLHVELQRLRAEMWDGLRRPLRAVKELAAQEDAQRAHRPGQPL